MSLGRCCGEDETGELHVGLDRACVEAGGVD